MIAFRSKFYVLLCTTALSGALSATSLATEHTDPVITAMTAELSRAMTQLGDDQYPAPYYVSYTVHDLQTHRIAAKQGAMLLDDVDRTRDAYVDVRVGDYAFDNSEDEQAEWAEAPDFEPLRSVPLADSPTAIQHALWLLTDLRYKQAASSYLRLKGRRLFEAAPKRERVSHSRAPAVVDYAPLNDVTVDLSRWRAITRRLSAQAADSPEVFDSEVEFRSGRTVRWFVNSEGVRVRTQTPFVQIHVLARTRADDGMLLEHSVDRYAPVEAELPTDDQLIDATAQMLTELEALRNAPELGPYTGPALLAPRAAGVFFHEVLGHRLEAHRQDSEDEGQTFADHLGKRVVPTFLSVYDDPSRAHLGATPLNGTYAIDDEGVRSERTTLVDRGVLRGFLMGRRPAPGFDSSNGHGRAAGVMRPTARMGNLIVHAHRTVSDRTLLKRLLAEVRKQGKPFGLWIRDLSGGQTNTSSYGYQAFKGEARMVYKVDAKTGEKTLVRGVDLVGTPLATLAKITAAGQSVGVFNGYCGAESGMVPVSTVAPALVFSEVELQRTARARGQKPLLNAPAPAQDGP
ncbi:MAG: TldD/PmbA family protein [Myxococcota bacterium]